MALGIKSFRFNRKDDWLDAGKCYGLDFKDDLLIIPAENGGKSFFVSYMLDSTINEVLWNRIVITADLGQNVFIKTHVYTSDYTKVHIDNFAKEYPKGMDINKYLMDESIDMDHKIAFLLEAGAKTYDNCNDMQLFEFKGRYMWLIFELINYSETSATIEDVRIEFPKKSFTEYLPEIYQKDTGQDFFLQRFVGVFQSLYLDLDDNISDVPRIFDPKTASPDFLNALVELMSFPHASLWGEEKLRTVLQEVISLYKFKGTIRSIARVVELYTGERPIIVEKIRIEDKDIYKNSKKRINNLFGENGYFFSVFISEESVKEVNSYANLLKIIDDFKPIDAICNLVVLSREIHLDYHCYIGINSNISGEQYMLLNEVSPNMAVQGMKE